VSRKPALPLSVEKGLLIGLGVVAVYAALIPLGGGTPPDLLYCLLVAWTIRRPASAPLWIVVGLGLFGDAMLSRPLGLGALALMLATEAFRANRTLLQGLPFLVEWLAASLVFAATLAGMQVALLLVLAERPNTDASVAYMLTTVLAYPLVVAGLALGLQLRAPGRTDHPLGRMR
jgi:rod shape-determining protein MreD